MASWNLLSHSRAKFKKGGKSKFVSKMAKKKVKPKNKQDASWVEAKRTHPKQDLATTPLVPTHSSEKNVLMEFNAFLKKTQSSNKPSVQEWQEFFSRHPFVFTETIPVKFDSVRSQVRLSNGPVDFLFHRNSEPYFFSTTGLIGTKRHKHEITDIYDNHLELACNASQGLMHLKDSLKDLDEGSLIIKENSIAIGDNQTVFIIIGLNEDIILKCHSEIRQKQLQGMLPSGVQVLTYDSLFNILKCGTPPTVSYLIAEEYINPSFAAVLVSGPPASGKSTLINRLCKKDYPQHSSAAVSKKYTTRSQRAEEFDEFIFCTPGEFERHDKTRISQINSDK